MALDLFGPSVGAGGVTARPSDTRLLSLLDTWFKDCSDPVTEDGTEDQAAWRNAILALLRSLARGNGQTGGAVDIVAESNVNDSLLLLAVQHLIQRNVVSYADAAGTANAITVALSPALAEYKTGFKVWTKILATNTTAAVTININGLGVKSLKTVNGIDPGIGACPAGAMMCFEYDGTNFQIISVLGAAAFSLPKCIITLGAIGSLAYATQSIHGMTVASHNDLGAGGPPISGGNAVTLPAGTYAFQIYEAVTCTLVNNNTQLAQQARLLKNGSIAQFGFETTYLLAGQNVTTYPGFAGTIQVNGTDTLQVAAYEATTNSGDYGSGNAPAGSFISFQRIGP